VVRKNGLTRVLVHRYNNELDIRAIEERGYSDVLRSVARNDFELVVVVPTQGANSELTVVADAVSEQMVPPADTEPWPGLDLNYNVRVYVDNVRYTVRDRVKDAFAAAGVTWASQWTVLFAELDEDRLFRDTDKAVLEQYGVPPGNVSSTNRLAEEVPGAEVLFEGAVKSIQVNAYERNQKARRQCIQHYGPICQVCGFDFAKQYGDIFEGFIHVHHLVPLAAIGKKYEIDPIHDLRPVCANCHAVIHFGKKERSLEEVRAMMIASAAQKRV
jgi:hypothetical protein